MKFLVLVLSDADLKEWKCTIGGGELDLHGKLRETWMDILFGIYNSFAVR